MKKSLLLVCLFAGPVLAELGPHPLERTQMKNLANCVTYKDKMSDGTFRDSMVSKPEVPDYPVRITLIATNNLPSMWELVYVAAYENGKRETNNQYVVKDKVRDRVKIVPTLPPHPEEITNRLTKVSALEHAKVRIAEAATPNRVVKMGKKQARELSVRVENGKAVRTMTDGSVVSTPLRMAYTARVTAPAEDKASGAGGSAGALAGAALAGALAGAAATAGAKKIKKG